MSFHELEFPLGGLDPDAVEAVLDSLGALSVTLVDRGDDPVLEPKPGEIRLWPDTLVRALFDGDADAAPDAGRAAVLAQRLGVPPDAVRVRGVADRDWERVWLADWRPLKFGRRTWVCPTTAQHPDDPAAVVVWLDPGLAFGTGTHPTTAMCLEALDSMALGASTVIDYGCGSGILAIAAVKLGARHALAVDIDPQALLATRANAARNGVSAAIETRDADATLAAADFVLANILAGPLVELAPRLAAACRPGGELVLSGLLTGQAAEVAAAYQTNFDIVSQAHRDDWCCIRARRRRGIVA